MAKAWDWLHTPTSIVPLVMLRVVFGGVMCVSMVRFLAKGWVEPLYIAPTFHFTYYGLGWLRPLPGLWMYAIFGGLALLALCIMVGLWYRVSVLLFWLLFTYVELLDQSYYLNHYYFISVLSGLLIFLPLHHSGGLDAWRHPALQTGWVPLWMVGAVRLQVGLVYFFAGVAKLQSDWLGHALPLKIWLRGHTSLPLVGPLFDSAWLPYLMSWGGALYDLTIPFLLLWSRTRPGAYLLVVLFHTITGMLFPIGMFPWIMIGCTLVFFSAEEWRAVGRWWGWGKAGTPRKAVVRGVESARVSLVGWGVAGVLLFQLLLPLRHWLYPGNVLWTEEGFRFAWHVMLVEKTGHVTFVVRDPYHAREWEVFPSEFLTPQQEKQMSFQPDMILAFAHHLDAHYQGQGLGDVEVRAEAYVSLNGRPSRLLIDPTVDLSAQPQTWGPYPWIMPLP